MEKGGRQQGAGQVGHGIEHVSMPVEREGHLQNLDEDAEQGADQRNLDPDRPSRLPRVSLKHPEAEQQRPAHEHQKMSPFVAVRADRRTG